jgi:MazG family protein
MDGKACHLLFARATSGVDTPPAMTAPRPPQATNDTMSLLLSIMERLRDAKSGCPWDREQTFATIAPYTIEEAYEVADAIRRRDMGALKDELGDLLFQVVFHAEMAREAGSFAFADVAAGLVDKMVRRHPHVFGDAHVADAAEQTVAWEEHKAAERATALANNSALDGVALSLPALLRAQKLQARAARVGFDWPALAPVLEKIAEELTELKREIEAGSPPPRLGAELGDVLFSIVNLARRLDLDAEGALRDANARFEARFRRVEELLRAAGKDPRAASLAEMDAFWGQAKREEKA